MNNFYWWVLSVTVFSCIWYLIVWYLIAKRAPGKNFFRSFLKSVAVIALLCLPFNINGVIITPLGSGQGNAVVSFFSLYQQAEGTAFSFLGGIYQRAGRNAITFVGLAGYQRAGEDAITFIGLAGYQRAGNSAAIVIGLAVYQQVPGKSRWFVIFSELLPDKSKKVK